MLEINKTHEGDCIEMMQHIPDSCVNMIICDLPYNVTQCKWDKPIDLQKLWKEYKRILKSNGVVVLTGTQPFVTDLINSNRDWFKYDWIWQKTKGSGHLNTTHRPLNYHEHILVFYKKVPTYNPRMVYVGIKDKRHTFSEKESKLMYNKHTSKTKKDDGYRVPSSVIKCFNTDKTKSKHPTEKPVKLFKYLIETYTNEGDLVLDNCMGSGTTGVACKETNRKFIGIELDGEYVAMANKRTDYITMTDFWSNDTHNRNLTEDFAKSSQINPSD